MNVLHVIDGMDPRLGGVCQAVRMMVSGLDELEVTSEVVCAEEPDTSYLTYDRFIVHILGKGKGPWSYCSELIPWLKSHYSRFDAVLLHGLWLYQGYAVSQVHQFYKNSKGNGWKKERYPKLFVMPHGMLDPYFQRASDRKFKALRNWVYWKIIESNVVNNADGVLFTSQEECRLAQKTFRPYRPKKEFVVGLGVAEPPPYTPSMSYAFAQACPGLQNAPFLLYLSRIHEKKGVDLLIKAYEEITGNVLRNNLSGLDLGKAKDTDLYNRGLPKLVIAGPGMETSYGHILRQKVLSSTELKGAVFFPGMLTGDAKWGAFYACDAFVLPSHQENFGIAVVEALSCSKLVLTSNKINIWREIVAAGGGIAAEDTFAGVKDLLTNWIHASSDARLEMNRKARGCYEKHFAEKPAADKLLEAISSEFQLV